MELICVLSLEAFGLRSVFNAECVHCVKAADKPLFLAILIKSSGVYIYLSVHFLVYLLSF